jgi:hypothetical protein
MINIDTMTSSEWLNYRDSLLENYCKAGNVLLINNECKFCDSFNEYVCFECEVYQIEQWRKHDIHS